MLLVVAYDIAHDRRRVRLHTWLLGFCNPVQESLFECDLDERQLISLQRGVQRRLRPAVDNVRYYALCERCAAHVTDASGRPRPGEPDVIIS